MSSDVTIVGAGPAGAWAAYRLARGGARVTIFDPSHPREKPCGGGVTGRALALVAPALDRHRFPASIIRTARFFDSATGASASVSLDASRGECPDLLVASRTDFDGALLAAAGDAGAEIVSSRVTDVVADNGGFRVETRHRAWRAAHLIGGDGANSLVRRRLAQRFRRDQLSIATGYFAHDVTSDEIVIELLADPPGYIWSFPRPTHLAIGVCAQADAGIGAPALGHRTARWIRDTGIAGDARLDAYSWPIPSLDVAGLRQLDLNGRGWCLVGDAAGLVDPITREGIYFALQSGAWAAESLIAHDSLDEYASRVRDEIVPELMRAARFKTGFFRPAFTGLMVRALQHRESIRAVVADLIAGRQPYATLKWRLLKTLDVGLAWRALAGSGQSAFDGSG